VPWSGNAKDWYWNAQAYGRSVGRTPVPGAIMVTWESGYGHVAYVESTNGNTFTVSEMNYKGFGIVSTRTLTTSQVPLIGFIY
jgi:peptidoglycan DL-endopeptidase CwlO